MALPIPKVEVAFGTAPLTVPGTWTDITAYVRNISIRRGRDHELARSQAGECTLVLKNTDRRFDPTNASGAYYPNVLPMRQVRVTVTHNAVTYPLFYGYIETWNQTWPYRPRNAIGDAEAEVHAVDGFKLLTLYNLKDSYPRLVLADSPTGYWMLDDPVGSPAQSAVDSRDDLPRYAGSGANFGYSPGPLLGGMTALDLTPSLGSIAFQNLAVGTLALCNPYIAVEFWIRADALPSGNATIFFSKTVNQDSSSWADYFVYLGSDGSIKLRYTDVTSADYLGTSAAGLISTGAWTHVVAHRENYDRMKFYKNGVLHTTDTNAGWANTFVTMDGHTEVQIGNPSVVFDFQLAHVAVYAPDQAFPSGFDTTIFGHHYAATFGLLPQNDAGAQASSLLDQMGWPAGLRTIDTGEFQIAATMPSGPALEHLLATCEDAERGLLQMSADGKVTFHSRGSLEATSGSHGASQATFGDGASDENYSDLVFRYDDQDLWTRVQVATDEGIGLAEDASALSAYGPRTLEVQASRLAYTSDAELLARFLLACYRSPELRPVKASFELAHDTSMAAATLVRDTHHDRVTIARHPPGGGTISMDAHIEGITWDIVPGEALHGAFDLVPDNGVTFIFEDLVGGTIPVSGVNPTIAFSHATTGGSGTTVTLSGYTPGPAYPYYIGVVSNKGTTPDTPTLAGTNGWNTTWTNRGTVLDTTGLRRITLFTGVPSSGTPGDLTATFAGSQTTSGIWVGYAPGGASGAPPQVVTNKAASGTTASATLATPNSASGTIGFLYGNGTSGTVTDGAGFNANSSVGAYGTESFERRNDAVTLVDFTGLTSQAWTVMAVEVASTTPAMAGSMPSPLDGGVTVATSGAGSACLPAPSNTTQVVIAPAGVIRLETGTTTTGRAALIGPADVIQLGTLEHAARIRVFIWTVSDGTETYTLRVGMGDSSSAESVDFVGFRYTHSVNGGRWQGVCRSNSTETTRDTGILAQSSMWTDLGFIVNAAGNSVQFTVDGSAAGAPVTTNIPTGASRKMTYLPIFLLKSAGTTNRMAYIDRYAYIIG